MCHNKSGRYESRFSTVKINPSKAIMFKDMDESILGVWIAHAEGNSFEKYVVIQKYTRYILPIQQVLIKLKQFYNYSSYIY